VRRGKQLGETLKFLQGLLTPITFSREPTPPVKGKRG